MKYKPRPIRDVTKATVKAVQAQLVHSRDTADRAAKLLQAIRGRQAEREAKQQDQDQQRVKRGERVPSYNAVVRWFLGGGEVEGTLCSVDCVPEIEPPPWPNGHPGRG